MSKVTGVPRVTNNQKTQKVTIKRTRRTKSRKVKGRNNPFGDRIVDKVKVPELKLSKRLYLSICILEEKYSVVKAMSSFVSKKNFRIS